MTYTSNQAAGTIAAGTAPKRRLGEIFVAQQIISKLTSERVLNISKRTGKRFGEILEDLGLVTGEELAKALAIQYGYSVAFDFAKFNFSSELLSTISAEVAAEHLIFPLKFQGNVLAIAMADPTNSRAIDNIKRDQKLATRIVLSTRKNIRAAIDLHYLRKKEGGETKKDMVLLAEDDKLVTMMISDILRRNGYDIVTAGDGMEAFKKAICYKPSVIITDKEMPKLNGYMLFNSLKTIKEAAEIPVLLMSASNNPEEEVVAFDKGFFDYLSKPVRDTVLLTKIKRAILAYTNIYAIK